MSTANAQVNKPTIVFVHGAFAESSSWNGVLTKLITGYPTVAILCAALRATQIMLPAPLKTSTDPSYWLGILTGAVITNAVNGNRNVKALVYVAGFAPEAGETAIELSGRYPGTLGPTRHPLNCPMVVRPLHSAGQVPPSLLRMCPANAQLMASTQRDYGSRAERSLRCARMKSTPSWFIYGDRDLNIPPAALSSWRTALTQRRPLL